VSRWSLDKFAPVRIEGRFWRMLSPRWHHAPLSGDGAARAGGRWNAAGTPALYLSDAHAAAIAEYMQALVHPGTFAPYDVMSEHMLDLADPVVRTAAGIDDALLTLPWRRVRDIYRGVPESWTFADAAMDVGFDGMRVPSTQVLGNTLVLWRWGGAGAKVSIVDPSGLLG
jgi:RES domain-containing protein